MEKNKLSPQFLACCGLLSILALLPGKALAQQSSPANESHATVERWTLQEWLEQKNRITLMDMWLVMHTPSPYEFYVSGSFESYTRGISVGGASATNSSVTSEQGSVGAFASITGLVGQYENNVTEGYTDLNGSFQLRLLGASVQGSHLIAIVGVRDRQYNSKNGDAKIQNNFAGGNLEMDITRFFGLQADYRYFLPATDSVLGSTQAHRLEAGAFIDFKKLRVFGNFYHETQDSNLNQVDTRTDRSGIFSGVTFFF